MGRWERLRGWFGGLQCEQRCRASALVDLFMLYYVVTLCYVIMQTPYWCSLLQQLGLHSSLLVAIVGSSGCSFA